jgi:hypothetical protein
MKFSAIVILTLSATLAAAQDRIAVPLSNPSQPVTLKANFLQGSITVTGGGAANQVVVDLSAGGDQRHPHQTARERDTPPPGMHRIGPNPGLDVEEDHNTVTISRGPFDNESISVQVPVNTSVNLRTVNGRIEVTGVNGDIDVEAANAPVAVKNVMGAVVAHTLNGTLTVSLDRVAPNKPMSFTTLNGTVDVTLPADTKARLRLKTHNGSIFTDFDVKMEPDTNKPVVQDNRSKDGKYRIVVDNGLYGSINGGGPEYLFQTLNGRILIHKK